jgi:prefoldin subunit 5
MQVNEIKAILNSAVSDLQGTQAKLIAAKQEVETARNQVLFVKETSMHVIGLPDISNTIRSIEEALQSVARGIEQVRIYGNIL